MDQWTEQLNLDVSPLSVRCAHCGGEASFDLARQNYHCLFCGEVTGIERPRQQAEDWQARRQDLLRRQIWDSAAALYRCPGCGATTLCAEAAQADCVFCGAALQRDALSRDLDVPALALPFALTPEEARHALRAWAGRSAYLKEARRVSKGADRLEACYLPCLLVRGPVGFQVSRAACARQYSCRSFAEDVLVNSSAQVDSLLLGAAGPFDWSQASPFTPDMLAQSRVKLRDLPEALLDRRTLEELAMHHLGPIERTLHSSDLQLQPDLSEALCLQVLLPVYLLTVENTRVIVNGQTGRVAVNRDKPSRSRERYMEPLILSLLAALLWMYVSAGNLETFILATAASIVLIFALLGGQRGERLHRRLFRIQDPPEERYEGHCLRSEALRPAPERGQPQLLFLEELDGQPSPVEIRYYTPKRIGLFLLFALLVLLLPWLLAVLITALRALFGGGVQVSQVVAAYGAVWYVLSAAALLLGALSLGRSLLYDHPLLYRILPGDRTEAVPPGACRPGRLSLWKRLRNYFRADALVGLAFGALVILLASVWFMSP